MMRRATIFSYLLFIGILGLAAVLTPASVAAQEAEAPTLLPGPGWTAPTPQPEAVGTGDGSDVKCIARWDVVPYQTIDCYFEVGVVAFHMNGIDRVEFSVDNGPWEAVRTPTLNPRTKVKEYWANLNCDSFQKDGPIEVRAVVYPVAGVPRVLAGDNVQIPNGEHSMFLFANGKGSFVKNQVFVSSTGSNTNPGTRDQPFQTIAKALDIVADGGDVVLLDAATYMFPQRSTTGKRFNERWITVCPDDGLAPGSVTIGTLQFSSVRPEIARIHWKGVAFDFNQIDYFNQAPPTTGVYHLWFDQCQWFDALGWLNRPTRSLPVRGARYYATDSTARDVLYGFASAILVRGGSNSRISGDVFQNSYAVFQCNVNEVGGAISTFHSDLYQNYGDADNIIVYDLQASDLKSTQAFFLQPTYQSTAGSPRYGMTNCAFVDVNVENVRVFQSGIDWGGPPWSQMQSKFDHILFRDIKLPCQRLMVRDDLTSATTNQWWEGRNIVFERVGFHPQTWAVYSNPAKCPPGVRFISCYSAP